MIQMPEEKIKFSILVRDRRERVYDALTTAEGLDAWFTSGASVDARPGGKIFFRWQDWGLEGFSGENEGSVLDIMPPEHFAFQWSSDDKSFITTVNIYFSETGRGTVVRLTEHGFPDTPAGRKNMIERATGWGHILTLMKFYLEYGVKY